MPSGGHKIPAWRSNFETMMCASNTARATDRMIGRWACCLFCTVSRALILLRRSDRAEAEQLHLEAAISLGMNRSIAIDSRTKIRASL